MINDRNDLPIHASKQNAKVGDREREEEELELAAIAQLASSRVERVAVAVDFDGEVGDQSAEAEHGDDLEDEAGDGDFGAGVERWPAAIVVARRGRQPAAGALQRHTDDVARDEDPRVPRGRQTAEVGAEGEADVLERVVDPAGVECGSDGEQDDGEQEAGKVEGVVVEHQLRNVADHFADASADHGAGEEPCLVRMPWNR